MKAVRPVTRGRLTRTVAILGVGALVATLAPAGASSASSIPTGGTITVEASLNPTFDPALNFISTFTDGPEMEALYGPGLLYQNANTGGVEMGFAKSLKSSQGGKVWTLALRPGLKFADGTPFNAAAVVTNMKRIANPAIGSTEQAIAAGITTTAPSPTTVVYTLKAPNTQFASVIAQDFAMIASPTALAKEGTSYGSKPVGPGPFKMGTLTTGVSLSLVKNPFYSLYQKGQPYLDGITFELVTTTTQGMADLQSGQAQVAGVTSGQSIQQDKQIGMTVNHHSTVGGAWLDINQGKAPFNNKLAREAVYLALNRKAVANVWAPGNPVSTNYFPKTSPYYNPKYNYPPGNSAKAQQLFNQLAAQGHPVDFAILWPSGSLATAAAYLASVLNGYKNVHVTQDLVLPATYTTDLNETQNYQMTAYGFYNTALFPVTAQVFQTGGALNYEKISDPKIDTAINQMQASPSGSPKFKNALGDFLAELISQYDIIPTQQGDIGLVYNSKLVGGIHPIEFGIIGLWGEMYRK